LAEILFVTVGGLVFITVATALTWAYFKWVGWQWTRRANRDRDAWP